MSAESRIVAAVLLAGLLVWLLLLLRRRQLRGKYALFWFGAIVILVVLVLWPDTAAALVGGSGEQSAFNGFVLAVAGFAVLALMHMAWEVSRLEERSRILAEEIALPRTEEPDVSETTLSGSEEATDCCGKNLTFIPVISLPRDITAQERHLAAAEPSHRDL